MLTFTENICSMEINPFYLSNVIPDKFFCDRKNESESLVNAIINQANVVLTAKRRIGKTGLINHVFDEKVIRDNYFVLSIDILHTGSLAEFVQELGNATFKTVAKRSARLSKRFASTLKSLAASFGFDPVTGGPAFNLKLGDISSPDYTLDEIFQYLEAAEKPVIVAIDEFQQICSYPEKNTEEILRGKVQKLQNTHFVFCGSSRRLISQMFFSSKRPFYQSAMSLELEPIDRSIYSDFAEEQFSNADKKIDSEAVHFAYDTFRGVTMYVHRTLHDAFAMTKVGEECSLDDMKSICDGFIEEYGSHLKELLRCVSPQQKELLYAICRDREAVGITSGAFIKKHSLRSASAVQSSSKVLLADDMITKVGNTYTISDPMLEIWLSRIMNV